MDLREAIEKEQQTDTLETAKLLKSLPPKVLARRGLAMLNLSLNGVSTGLGGRTLFELGPDKAIGLFDPVVKVGDIVQVAKQPKQTVEPGGFEAVVVKVSKESIVVASDDDSIEFPDARLWIVKLVNEVTYKRIKWAIDRFENHTTTRLLDIVKGSAAPHIEQADFTPLGSLNDPQRVAVKHALGSEVAVIHGPPGTGKTATIVEIVRQLVAKGERVLICGPSNISVDNIVERLSPHVRGLLRLGHPARLLDSVMMHSLDLVAKQSNEGQVVRELQTEINQVLGKVKKARGSERKALWSDLKTLRKDYRVREKTVVRDLILKASVVVATLHSAGSKYLGDAVNFLGGIPLFHTIVIDEVSQALLPQCYIPLVIEPNAKRLVVAGDNKQLPPTIKSTESSVLKTLERTLFDQLVDSCGPAVKHLITIQYRMAQEIMEFPSKAMYNGKLIADKSVASHRLYHLPHVEKNNTTESVVLWVDTLGDMYPEQKEEEAFSTKNIGEAELVAGFLSKLLDSGVNPDEIGVISPYNAQVGELRRLLPSVEVSTVDGFQGREKEVILISLVRSNPDKEVGFVADDRRMNVAITRPRRQLVIFGDSETIGANDGFLKNWVEWCQDNADIEYADS
ncbi:DNA polymerase alpha-associated DNA helicase A [Wickerhamiella sorbophila]|uniref:DNA helicase n=1 Tax=Wickerhamiella sorbophila TaxID=45607 RepID=A0A2T0FEU1_9ASCO|nr:DNA polymerase alpha-associated DNA helicase A [Wickerhamiella sorbophila]PRT53516.1 DNA polymerase alpha-associated DNA helicase A [Wickerhamiella sorbophila]